MPSRKRKTNYFSGLFLDPVIKGKWDINKNHAHSVKDRFAFYRAVFIYLLSIFSILAFVTLILLAIFALPDIPDLKKVNFLCLVFLVVVILYLISFFVRRTCKCPLCRANPLLDGKSVKHAKACKIKPFNYSSTATVSILIRNAYRCQHCGTPFVIKKR